MHSDAPTPWLLTLLVLLGGAARAQSTAAMPTDREFVKIDAPLVALEHVRVIDGTGSPAKLDQTIIIGRGLIQTLGDSARLSLPAGAARLDLRGYTVIPGLVGMHNHLFCITSHSGMPVVREVAISFSRLYLAHGVTTIRTTGCIEPYTDLNLKKLIDQRKLPGPKMFVTAPYLEGAYQGRGYFQNHQLSGPSEAKQIVEFWADQGATSFKVYMHITRAELRATIEAAHRRGLKVTLDRSEIRNPGNPNHVTTHFHEQCVLIKAHKFEPELALIKSPRFGIAPSSWEPGTWGSSTSGTRFSTRRWLD